MTIGIKVCGITRKEDALFCLEAGADALGFNFYPKSPRYLDLETAGDLIEKLPPFGLRVGVFVEPTFEQVMEVSKTLRLDTIQLHGEEPPEIAGDLRAEGLRIWKAIRVQKEDSLKVYEDYPCDALLLDAFDPNLPGGSGRTFDWALLATWRPPVPWILSGGLTPENVAEAVQRLAPSGLDVASGVESSPGVKDPELVRTFILRAKQELIPVA
jgi:phosphoribosylanthranilate isomerase